MGVLRVFERNVRALAKSLQALELSLPSLGLVVSLDKRFGEPQGGTAPPNGPMRITLAGAQACTLRFAVKSRCSPACWNSPAVFGLFSVANWCCMADVGAGAGGRPVAMPLARTDGQR